jgi:hypothetical protein
MGVQHRVKDMDEKQFKKHFPSSLFKVEDGQPILILPNPILPNHHDLEWDQTCCDCVDIRERCNVMCKDTMVTWAEVLVKA